jgi:hypothetical protein
MDAFIRDLLFGIIDEFIQTQVFGVTMDLFSSRKNASKITFRLLGMKTKNPAGARFLSGFAVGSRRTHCVTSTQKVYAIEDERAI